MWRNASILVRVSVKSIFIDIPLWFTAQKTPDLFVVVTFTRDQLMLQANIIVWRMHQILGGLWSCFLPAKSYEHSFLAFPTFLNRTNILKILIFLILGVNIFRIIAYTGMFELLNCIKFLNDVWYFYEKQFSNNRLMKNKHSLISSKQTKKTRYDWWKNGTCSLNPIKFKNITINTWNSNQGSLN